MSGGFTHRLKVLESRDRTVHRMRALSSQASEPRRGVVLAVTDPMTVGFLGPLIRVIDEEPVTVVCGLPRDDGLDRANKLEQGTDVRVERIGWHRDLAPGRDLLAFAAAVRLLRRVRPRVVHSATPKAGLLLMLAAATTRVPVRISSVWGLRSEGVSGFKALAVRTAERLTGHASTLVICNSQSLADEYARRIGGKEPVVIASGSSHGVDADRFGNRERTAPDVREIRRNLGIRQRDRVIVFVGRLTPDKGLVELGEIAANLPGDTHLVIVGPDELTRAGDEHLKTRLSATARTHLVGPVADTVPWFHLASLLVLPSRREGFPNVVLEAAVAGVPAVGYAATGTVDAIVDGVTGWLVPVGDAGGFAATVQNALDYDSALRKRGEAARARAVAKFNPSTVAKATVAMYGSPPQPSSS